MKKIVFIFLLSGVFQCPQNFLRGVNTKHPHPQDCRQFFVCISGTAREYGCPLGSVFKITQNEDGVCADPADVGKRHALKKYHQFYRFIQTTAFGEGLGSNNTRPVVQFHAIFDTKKIMNE